ncbi:hypothetical protein J2780_002357 [Chryseobacterium camelliae]|nr:hypothetical protein [Chryseobacterium camelliae]
MHHRDHMSFLMHLIYGNMLYNFGPAKGGAEIINSAVFY